MYNANHPMLVRLLLHGLDIQVDLNVVADHQTATVEGLGIRQTPVAPVDLELSFEPNARVAPGVFDLAEDRKGYRNFFGNAVHGQRSDAGVTVTLLFDARALKGDLRVLGDIEEVRAAQIVVAHLVFCTYACSLDLHRHRGLR